MTKATIPGTNTTCGQTGVACYAYDRNGNRTSKQVDATTTTYSYDRTDELYRQQVNGGSFSTFTYNAYGDQLTTYDAVSGLTTSAYDGASRLLSVTPPGGTATTYAHDALGRLSTRTTGASADTFTYLGATDVAWRIANTGGATTLSAIDAAGNRTAVTGAGLTGYLGFDLHGNTALAENGAGAVTDALRYDAWGEVMTGAVSSGLPTPWRYQGRLDVGPDTSNPLYDFGARTYRPVEGTFTSLDSVAGGVMDPLSMNRFLYAEANPTSFVDPDGHTTCTGHNDDTCDTYAGLPTAKRAEVSKQWHAQADAQSWAIEEQYIGSRYSGGATAPPTLSLEPSAPEYVNPWALGADPTWQKVLYDAKYSCMYYPGAGACNHYRDLLEFQTTNRDLYCATNSAECAEIDTAERDAGLLTLIAGAELAGAFILSFDPVPGDEAALAAAGTKTVVEEQAAANRLQRALESVFRWAGENGAFTKQATRAKGVTVLGHSPTYSELGAQLGARYYAPPQALARILGRTERWQFNVGFLNATAKRGDIVRLATPVMRPGAYQEEINYMIAQWHYVPDASGNLLLPPGM